MIYVILPVHNRKKITESFIQNLVEQTYKDFKLILVDDGSQDGTSEMVLSYISSSVVISGKGDWWWGGSLQQAYKWIKINSVNTNDDILIINDDVEISKKFLEIGIESLKKNDKSLFLAKAISVQDKSKITCGIHVDWKKMTFEKVNKNEDINCFSTRGLFLSVESFLSIGGFHPFLLPHYLSDYEYTIRAYNKGYKLLVNNNLFLMFNENISGYHAINEKSFFTYMKKYFSKKNPGNPIYQISFVFLVVPWRWKIKHFVRISLVCVKSILNNI